MQRINIGGTPVLQFNDIPDAPGVGSVDEPCYQLLAQRLVAMLFVMIFMVSSGIIGLVYDWPMRELMLVLGIISVAVGLGAGFMLAVLLNIVSKADKLRKSITAGERREAYITPDDFSWRIVMNDNDEPRYDEALTVEFLSIPKVIGCDGVLRSLATDEQPDPAVYRTAKQIILRHAQEIFDSEEDRRRLTLMHGDAWQEYAAAEDK